MNVTKLTKLIDSKIPIIWLDTKEYFEATEVIKGINVTLGLETKEWDLDQVTCGVDAKTPASALDGAEGTVLIIRDMDLLYTSAESWRNVIDTIPHSIKNENTIIIVSPNVKIPENFKHYVVIHEEGLPTANEIGEELTGEELIKAANGLTTFEIQNFKEMHDSPTTKDLLEFRSEILKAKGLDLYNSTKGFDSIIGMDNMKDFCKKMVNSGNGKGILILGVPGGGKSQFAKSLGCETDRVTVNLDFGLLMGSYVGETEAKTKGMFETIDAIGQSIVFIDEIEKGLSGASNGGDVSMRQGGQFLKWMQDKSADSYVVATANNIKNLPSEYLRSGRWDAIFFVDVPKRAKGKEMLEYFKNVHNIKDDGLLAPGYTGAEIESICRLASSMDITINEASEYVSKITEVDEDRIKDLKKFAETRTVNADK